MYKQWLQLPQPLQLHRESGAMKFHLRHLRKMGESFSENVPVRTTELEARRVGAASTAAPN
jgi:hypothetical protein